MTGQLSPNKWQRAIEQADPNDWVDRADYSTFVHEVGHWAVAAALGKGINHFELIGHKNFPHRNRLAYLSGFVRTNYCSATIIDLAINCAGPTAELLTIAYQPESVTRRNKKAWSGDRKNTLREVRRLVDYLAGEPASTYTRREQTAIDQAYAVFGQPTAEDNELLETIGFCKTSKDYRDSRKYALVLLATRMAHQTLLKLLADVQGTAVQFRESNTRKLTYRDHQMTAVNAAFSRAWLAPTNQHRTYTTASLLKGDKK